MNFKTLLTLVSLLLVSLSCASYETWVVKEYKVPGTCSEMYMPRPCMNLLINDSRSKTFEKSGLKGFRYNWGYKYTLSVKVKKISDPPADGSSIEYTLDKVIKKEETKEKTFTLKFTRSWLKLIKDTAREFKRQQSGHLLLNQKSYTCLHKKLCAAIDRRFKKGKAFSVEFAFTSGGLLQAQKVK